jgi:hypothetical protein
LVKKVHPNNPALRNPQFARTVFDAGRQPAAWLSVGRNLRSSADVIFKSENPVANIFWNEMQRIHSFAANGDITPEFPPPPNMDGFHLLIAYAIENFLKGIIVTKGKANFTSQLELPGILKTHDLSKLNKIASPTATIALHLLDSLTYMSEWRGRYPIPISVDQFWPMHPNGTPKTPGFSWPGSYSEILEYCDHLEAELQALA